jgi:signal transduction histidine kinase
VAALVVIALRYATDGDVTITIGAVAAGVRITVADQGPGVPAAEADRLFERFARGEGQRRPGPGLGLYLVRGLVEAHGGRVWFDADVPVGATVHVVLPTG